MIQGLLILQNFLYLQGSGEKSGNDKSRSFKGTVRLRWMSSTYSPIRLSLTHVPSSACITFVVISINKKSRSFEGTAFVLKVASTYSPTLKRAVPSALAGLTSLFGMGRGGPRCYRHLKRVIDRFQITRLQILVCNL